MTGWKKALTLVFVLITIGLVVYGIIQYVTADDDRPPVVVSSGSVIFSLGAKGKANGDSWDSADGRHWKDKSTKPKVKKLELGALAGFGNATNCAGGPFTIDDDQVRITTASGDILVSIDGGDLAIDAPGNPVNQTQTTIEFNPGILTVRFLSKNNIVACSAMNKPTFTIFQKK